MHANGNYMYKLRCIQTCIFYIENAWKYMSIKLFSKTCTLDKHGIFHFSSTYKFAQVLK